ncbi:MAG TPA: hypothetical protein VEC56_10415 [Candidatus Krumholzibacteria bacterium]|nr:hypothetical protein [Candidatus Krumholzibacteria bacterium]
MSKRYRMGFVVAAMAAVLALPALAAVDEPSIGVGASGHAKQAITITAGPSGLPNGFAIWWMDRSTFLSNGGAWPTEETLGMGAAEFTGAPTLNTFGGQFTTFKLAPNQSIVVEIGDLFQETGVAGTTDELVYGEQYYFTAFGLDENGNAASDLSVTVSGTTTASTNCTYTQGYWKNHEALWPVTNLTLGSVNYTAAQLDAILEEPVAGNGLVSLAHQLIAAKLNVANGADPTAASAAIAAADALIGGLVVPPIGAGYLHPSVTSSLTQTLDDYNNGLIGPGHCGNVPAEETTWGGVKALYR